MAETLPRHQPRLVSHASTTTFTFCTFWHQHSQVPESMSVSQSDVSSHAQCASVCPRPHGQHRNALSRPRVLIRVAMASTSCTPRSRPCTAVRHRAPASPLRGRVWFSDPRPLARPAIRPHAGKTPLPRSPATPTCAAQHRQQTERIRAGGKRSWWNRRWMKHAKTDI